MLSELEKMQLRYLGNAHRPLWGGHLQRGEPISSPDMNRWLDLGLIQRVWGEGYVATVKCKAALHQAGA